MRFYGGQGLLWEGRAEQVKYQAHHHELVASQPLLPKLAHEDLILTIEVDAANSSKAKLIHLCSTRCLGWNYRRRSLENLLSSSMCERVGNTLTMPRRVGTSGESRLRGLSWSKDLQLLKDHTVDFVFLLLLCQSGRFQGISWKGENSGTSLPLWRTPT